MFSIFLNSDNNIITSRFFRFVIFFIVQHIDLDFRCMRYIKIDIIIIIFSTPPKLVYNWGKITRSRLFLASHGVVAIVKRDGNCALLVTLRTYETTAYM